MRWPLILTVTFAIGALVGPLAAAPLTITSDAGGRSHTLKLPAALCKKDQAYRDKVKAVSLAWLNRDDVQERLNAAGSLAAVEQQIAMAGEQGRGGETYTWCEAYRQVVSGAFAPQSFDQMNNTVSHLVAVAPFVAGPDPSVLKKASVGLYMTAALCGGKLEKITSPAKLVGKLKQRAEALQKDSEAATNTLVPVGALFDGRSCYKVHLLKSQDLMGGETLKYSISGFGTFWIWRYAIFDTKSYSTAKAFANQLDQHRTLVDALWKLNGKR